MNEITTLHEAGTLTYAWPTPSRPETDLSDSDTEILAEHLFAGRDHWASGYRARCGPSPSRSRRAPALGLHRRRGAARPIGAAAPHGRRRPRSPQRRARRARGSCSSSPSSATHSLRGDGQSGTVVHAHELAQVTGHADGTARAAVGGVGGRRRGVDAERSREAGRAARRPGHGVGRPHDRGPEPARQRRHLLARRGPARIGGRPRPRHGARPPVSQPSQASVLSMICAGQSSRLATGAPGGRLRAHARRRSRRSDGGVRAHHVL